MLNCIELYQYFFKIVATARHVHKKVVVESKTQEYIKGMHIYMYYHSVVDLKGFSIFTFFLPDDSHLCYPSGTYHVYFQMGSIHRA